MDRRAFLKHMGRAAVTAGLGGAVGLAHANRYAPYNYEVTEVTIPIANLPKAFDGFRIAHISDLHAEDLPLSYLERALDEVNGLNADLIAMTGDFVSEDAGAMDDLAPLLSELKAQHGVFACLGNHDVWADRDRVLKGLERHGSRVLDNEGERVTIGRSSLYIAGVADAWNDHYDLNAALKDAPEDGPTVLLWHEPDVIEQVSRDGRVDLQLSGHSHAGQIKVPFFGPPVLPFLGRRYPEGRYRVGDTWLYTNRGLGVSGLPIRFNCRPEITVLRLEPAPSSA